MNNANREVGIHENIQCDDNGQIIGVEYIYDELEVNTNQIQRYHAILKRSDYDQMRNTLQKSTFTFDTFIQIYRPFIMGKYAAQDIQQAFTLLDQDKSGHIDISELSSFIPLIRRDANPHLILHYIQKQDQNNDLKLNYSEFSSLILSGIGRDIIIGRV